jgi:hypothetical protein
MKFSSSSAASRRTVRAYLRMVESVGPQRDKTRPNSGPQNNLEADLHIVAGFRWKEGVVGSATVPSDLRSPPGRSFQTADPVFIRNIDEQQDFVLDRQRSVKSGWKITPLERNVP